MNHIKFWIEQTQLRLAQEVHLTDRLMDAHLLIEHLNEQLAQADRSNNAAGLEAEAEVLRQDLAAARQLVEDQAEQITRLNTEWETLSGQLMALQQENERLKANAMPNIQPKPKANTAGLEAPPNTRPCKMCKQPFRYKRANRKYCFDCKPLNGNRAASPAA